MKIKRVCSFATMVAAVFCACNVWAVAWNGHVEASVEPGSVLSGLDIAMTMDSVVRQAGIDVAVSNKSNNVFGRNYAAGWVGVYLQESGTLSIKNDWLTRGTYNQFRQLGGESRIKNFKVAQGSIPKDFVFGGSSFADIGYYGGGGSNPEFLSDFVIAVLDNATFAQPIGVGLVKTDASKHRIWAFNGGSAEYQTFGQGYPEYTPTNDFFVFNGGTRIIRTDASDWSHTNKIYTVFGYYPQIRVCEGGGGIDLSRGFYFQLPDESHGGGFKVPTNVIKSIALTPAAMSNIVGGVAQFWEVPPAVEFIDTTGTNAAAVVDYDFDNKVITNITLLSCGEGYSPDVKVQFRYRAGAENRLLETPLDCTIGDARGGDFTFSSTNLVSTIVCIRGATNWWHGALIVDMNRLGLDDSELAIGGGVFRFGDYCLFPNIDSIVLKSGLLYSDDSRSNAIFPSATKMELYGGYLGRLYNVNLNTVVVGGVVRLWARSYKDSSGNLRFPTYINVNAGGTMFADASALTNGVVPTLIAAENMRGNNHVTFGSGSKVAVKNWDALPRGRKTLVLDLSLANVKNTPAVEQSEDGVLWWDNTEKKLYARRHADGVFLIFR